MIRTALFAFALALAALVGGAACDSYDPVLGDHPFRCGDDEPRCPDGYAAVDSGSKCVCEPDDGSGVTPQIDASNTSDDAGAVEQ